MTTFVNSNRAGLIAGATATLAVAAMGFAGAVQARDNVYWSAGVATPGSVVNVGNALPVYTSPQVIYTPPSVVYTQPRPVYVQPQPVYVQPRPYYYGQPQVVYVQPGHHKGWYKNKHKHKHEWYGREHDDDDRDYYGHNRFQQGYQPGYQQGYAPVYDQR